MTNEHNLIKRLYPEALDEPDSKERLKVAGSSAGDAFYIVKILPDRFSSDVAVEEGTLKE